MLKHTLILVEDAPLPYVLSMPAKPDTEKQPVLVFLHGLGEGPPTEIFAGITAHGPLRPGSSLLAMEEFIIAAPQLPARGDNWRYHTDAVIAIARQVQHDHGGDPSRTYLTGFSFGGNGVFDVALDDPFVWSALWPVDPTRVPEKDPGLPVWVSSGEASRPGGRGFISRLSLQPPDADDEDRVYLDEGLDHVGTATAAYRSDCIYRWLLSRHR